jgi:tRNA A37 threonylcarbamoyltransferase TsaD
VHFYEPPEKILCLDNAAIVAGFAYHKLKAGLTDTLDCAVSARAQF